MLGSLVGGCNLGFPGFELLSSDPDSVCGKPLHSIRGKGSHFSVGQDLYFRGHGRVLPFHRCMLGVPVRVLVALALLRGVPSSSAAFAAYVYTCCSRGVMAITGSGAFFTAHRNWRIRGLPVLSSQWLG